MSIKPARKASERVEQFAGHCCLIKNILRCFIHANGLQKLQHVWSRKLSTYERDKTSASRPTFQHTIGRHDCDSDSSGQRIAKIFTALTGRTTTENQPQLIAKLPSTIQLKLFPSINARKLEQQKFFRSTFCCKKSHSKLFLHCYVPLNIQSVSSQKAVFRRRNRKLQKFDFIVR